VGGTQDEKCEEKMPKPRIELSPDLRVRYKAACDEIFRNADEYRAVQSEVWEKPPPRSRVTEAVRVEVGSDDPAVCRKFLKDLYCAYIAERFELEYKLFPRREAIRLEAEELVRARDRVRAEVDREIATWQREHPGVVGILAL
jgi:hypothetical protein